MEALENEKYDEAIDLISAMKPEPETEVVKINLDNWTEYFSINVIKIGSFASIIA